MLKPCDTCSRVKNPADCENKKCLAWQEWFCRKWEELREKFRRAENGDSRKN
jgi:hypothetical protein